MPAQTQTLRCPIAETLKLISGKWKAVILYRVSRYQPVRFGQLQKLIPDCGRRMLALQLKSLEEAGLLAKKVYDVQPPKTEYRLTAKGESLLPMIQQMQDWSADQPQDAE